MLLDNLFSASVALAGFIAVFLVFRYQTIDTYVDNRKPVLRSLLENEIRSDPSIVVKIQDIGKDPQVDEAEFSRFNSEEVTKFVNDILILRKRRHLTVYLGLASIIIWGALSLFYLLGSYYIITNHCATMLFGIAMIFTLWFIIFSFYTKRPE